VGGTNGARVTRVKKDRQWPPHLRTLAVSFTVLVCVVLATSDGVLHLPSPKIDGLRDYSIRSLLVVTALAIGWTLYHRDWKGLIANASNPSDQAFTPDESWLADLQTHIESDMQALDRRGIIAFIDLLVNPARYRVRVAENVDFAERGLRQQVTVEFGLPPFALEAKYLYLPVLLPIKGELLDNFRLYDASGKSLANLSYEETTRLAAVGLTYLLSAYEPTNAGEESHDSSATAIDQIVLLGPVAKRGRINLADTQSDIDERLNALRTKVSDSTRERLRAYLQLLTATYPIVVIVSPASTTAGRLLVTYEVTLIPRSERNGLEGKLRLALGLRPHQIAIPVDLAYSAQSYHLRINGPTDKYVIRQYLRCRHCGKLVRRSWRAESLGVGTPGDSRFCFHTDPVRNGTTRSRHFRLRQRRGQSYVHLYMRGYASDDAPRNLELLARFKEAPPGSLANAAATALITTLLIAIAGYVSGHIQGTVYSDVPALILALPVAAASWMGITEDSGKLVGSSLLARLSLITSGTLAIISIIVYLSLTPKMTVTTRPRASDHVRTQLGTLDPHQFAILGIHNLWWAILLALSLLNFAYAAFRFFVRLTYYNYLRRKPSFGEAEYGN
jgi:hypothetical protein